MKNAVTVFNVLPLLLAMGFWPLGAAAQQAPPSSSQPQVASNPCLNVPEARCALVAGCVWLPGYKVKGAADVPGYCRAAPKPLTSRRPGDAPAKQ